MKSTSTKLNPVFCAWALLALLYFFLRYQNIPGVFSEAGLVIPDTDPYYRLYRIVQIVQGSWSYPLFETKLNFPIGQEVAWPLGLDLLIAAPLKLLHVEKTFLIEAYSFLIIPILSLPIIIFSGLIAAEIAGSWIAIGCVFFLILMRTLLFQTSVGRLDHHLFEALFPVMFYWFWLQIAAAETKKYMHILFASALGLSLSFYPQAWLFFLMILVISAASRKGLIYRKMSEIFFLAFWISLVPLSMTYRFWEFDINFTRFSWWGTLVLVFCACSCAMLPFQKMRGGRIGISKKILGVSAIVLIIFLIMNGKIREFFWQFHVAFSWLRADHDTLQSTKESWSPARFSFSQLHDIYLIYAMPLVFAWFVWRKKYFSILLYSFVPILLTFFQIRFMTMASPWIAMLIVLFIVDLVQFFPKTKKNAVWISLALILAVSIPYFPKPGWTQNKTHDYYFYPVRLASLFLKEGMSANSYPSGTGAVAASWDYGHWILFYSGHNVIAQPFQSELTPEVQKLFGTEDQNGIEKFRAFAPFEFLFVENSIKRFKDALIFSGHNPDEYFTVHEAPSGNRVVQFRKQNPPTFYDRMLNKMGNDDFGNFSDHLRLVYVSPLPSDDDSGATSLKVYQYVPGARIRIHSKAKGLVLRTGLNETEWNQHHVLEKMSSIISENIHEWVVPYGNYDQGGVQTDGEYEILSSNRKIIHRHLQVTEDEVLKGKVIQLDSDAH